MKIISLKKCLGIGCPPNEDVVWLSCKLGLVSTNISYDDFFKLESEEVENLFKN